MDTITIDSKAFKIIMDRLTYIEQSIKTLSLRDEHRKWIFEDKAMLLTGLSKRSLRDKRKKGEFNYSTATGRKIKYLRSEIEAYLNENSTVL